MLINDFIEQLQTLTGQPRRRPHAPTVHVAVNNAAYRRPSAALIEVAGMPDLALLVGHLQADYAGRTLVLGRDVWRAGAASARPPNAGSPSWWMPSWPIWTSSWTSPCRDRWATWDAAADG